MQDLYHQPSEPRSLNSCQDALAGDLGAVGFRTGLSTEASSGIREFLKILGSL